MSVKSGRFGIFQNSFGCKISKKWMADPLQRLYICRKSLTMPKNKVCFSKTNRKTFSWVHWTRWSNLAPLNIVELFRTILVSSCGLKTSRERPKSALYLRLKIVKEGPFGLFETPVGCTIWRKLKGRPYGDFKKFQKFFKMRFSISVTVPKNVKGRPLGFFDIHCVAKRRKKWRGDPLVQSKKFQNSPIVPKKSGGGALRIFPDP